MLEAQKSSISSKLAYHYPFLISLSKWWSSNHHCLVFWNFISCTTQLSSAKWILSLHPNLTPTQNVINRCYNRKFGENIFLKNELLYPNVSCFIQVWVTLSNPSSTFMECIMICYFLIHLQCRENWHPSS